MKICISASSNRLEAQVDPRFVQRMARKKIAQAISKGRPIYIVSQTPEGLVKP
ncbi:MAG: hypothetical protein QXN87_04365 [Candidatus Bathyarchaeia archaeon]